MSPSSSWQAFFEELADALLPYKHRRSELAALLNEALQSVGLEEPSDEIKDGTKAPLIDIDPFTFFAFFNRKITLQKRLELCSLFKQKFSLQASIPSDFEGIALMNNQKLWFFPYASTGEQTNSIDLLWLLFEAALLYAQNPSQHRSSFSNFYSQATQLKGVKFRIATALFYIRPNTFLPLDSLTRSFLQQNFQSLPLLDEASLRHSEEAGKNYLTLLEAVQEQLPLKEWISFSELSVAAFQASLQAPITERTTLGEAVANSWKNPEVREKRLQRHPVIANGLPFDSTRKAFYHYNLPDEKHIQFRLELVAEGEKTFTCNDGRQVHFVLDKDPNNTSDSSNTPLFLSETQRLELQTLLKRKKNLILQGSPGVGKTFVAKRLANALLGETDSTRCRFVQFHQSYSYEDFIQGYRPQQDKDGFALHEGTFYRLCKAAEANPHQPHVLLIDEINRGNVSKIFGELLMLIETDKRGQKAHLLYDDGKNAQATFCVPKNLYIIGMMNTADRSLALMDYALRRRFAFYTLKPAFENEQFQALLPPEFQPLVAVLKQLNEAIRADAALGDGFEIGHSYVLAESSTPHEVVEYELIPLLQEYWFDDPKNLASWSERLREGVK